MSVDNLQDRLKAMQSPFQEAEMDAPGQKPWPPDGKYQALVKGFDFFESKDGVLFLKTILQIALSGTDWDGAEVETIHNLEDPNRISWAKGHLHTLGIDVEQLDLGSLQGELESVLDVPVEIQIKTSDKKDANGVNYRNVYVQRRVGNAMPRTPDVPADTDDLDAAPTRETDGIPF